MRAAGVDGDDRLSDDGDDDNDIDNDDNDDDLDPMSLERAAALGMQGRGAGSPLESARSGMSSGEIRRSETEALGVCVLECAELVLRKSSGTLLWSLPVPTVCH